MDALSAKTIEAITSLDINDPKCESVSRLSKLSTEVLGGGLDEVDRYAQGERDNFAQAFDLALEKREKAVNKALELYGNKMSKELEVRDMMLTQRKKEHTAMLEANLQKSENDAAVAAKELETQKQADAHHHDRQLRQQERLLNKQAAEHQRELKKIERETLREEQKLKRIQDKDSIDHARAIKELEAKAERGQIERAARDGILEEFNVEMARYSREMDLAQEAMRSAIAKGKSCEISNSAPRIDWGSPPGVDPRIVPGTVSWKSKH